MARNSRHGRWGQCLSERQPNEPKTSRRRKCLTLDQFPYIRSTPLSQYPHRRCLNSKTRLTCANYNSETLEFRSKATASPNDPAMMLNETAAVMRRSQPRTRTRSRRKTGSAREDSFASQRLRRPRSVPNSSSTFVSFSVRLHRIKKTQKRETCRRRGPSALVQ